MGFGLLFIGYFLAVMYIPIFGIIGELIRIGGLCIMLYAAMRLSEYSSAFNITRLGIILMMLMSVLSLSIGVNEWLYDSMLVSKLIFSNAVQTIVVYIEQLVSFAFTSVLLWGIYRIAKETEVKKVSVGAIRNFIFLCLYDFIYLISFLPTKGIRSLQSELALIYWGVYFVTVLLNIVLIFSCYANICEEGDEEMEGKAYKIPLLSRLQAETDRRAQRARQADELYLREKKQKRDAKSKRKRGK